MKKSNFLLWFGGMLPLLCLHSIPPQLGTHALAVSSDTRRDFKRDRPIGTVQVSGLRKFPFPYQAMLAISSDADHQTVRKFNLIHRFLNTTEMTPMGRGVGLDVSDSFFMFHGSDLDRQADYDGTHLNQQLAYFKGTTTEIYAGGLINRYIAAGWMDTIHTYGDFTMSNPSETRFRRSLAKQAIATLVNQGQRLTVWTDHGNESNVQNFGSHGLQPFFDYQKGANPRSVYYHTDLLIPYGIKFVWTDQKNDEFGHDSMLIPMKLPDGQKVFGFPRFTHIGHNERGEKKWVWSMDQLADQLTPENLSLIEGKHQYAIVSQHLHSNNARIPMAQSSVEALRRLAVAHQTGKILVARTSRLLQYNVTERYLHFSTVHQGNKVFIHLNTIDDPVAGRHVPTVAELRGVTFYTSVPECTEIYLGRRLLDKNLIQRNPSDGIAPSVMVRWYPTDTTDYSQRDHVLPALSDDS